MPSRVRARIDGFVVVMLKDRLNPVLRSPRKQ
jgi:hypothetical protein